MHEIVQPPGPARPGPVEPRVVESLSFAGRLTVPPAGTPPHVWLLHVDELRTAAVRAAPDILDQDERGRAAALRRPADRASHLVSHVGLRSLLGRYLGVPAREVPLTRDPCPLCGGPHGRPSVAGSPLHFSLSHSGNLARLAFAATPVGADTEVIPTRAVAEEVAEALHPREREELGLLPAADRPLAFTRAWVRKEAYLKGLGTGLAGDPAATYVGSGPRPSGLTGPWTLTDLAVGPEQAAAFALRV